MVVIDSLNAYLQSMPGERHLLLQMHELLSYLNQRGIITLMVLGQHGLVGETRTDLDLSYLADAILLLRYFEADGEVRKAVSVVKTRTAAHERTIREFWFDETGVQVGEPLHGFRGLLTGTPAWTEAAVGPAALTGPAPARHKAVQPVLILAPRGRDAPVIERLLRAAGTATETCTDLAAVVRGLPGCSAVVVTEEALAGPDLPALLEAAAAQPPWSDLAFLVLATKQAGPRAAARTAVLDGLGNAVLLERP